MPVSVEPVSAVLCTADPALETVLERSAALFYRDAVFAGLATRFALTARQVQILRLLCEGAEVKVIAHLLSLSPKTVEAHVLRLGRQMGVMGRTQLVLRAVLASGIIGGGS